MQPSDAHRMLTRTTIMLDESTREAASELAQAYGCSTSEGIRRAILRQRDVVLGIPPAQREQRVRTLERLFELFEGLDAEDEIGTLKEQDEGF